MFDYFFLNIILWLAIARSRIGQWGGRDQEAKSENLEKREGSRYKKREITRKSVSRDRSGDTSIKSNKKRERERERQKERGGGRQRRENMKIDYITDYEN